MLGWRGGDQQQQPRAYPRDVEAVREGWKQRPWEQLTAQVALGSEAFVTELQDRVPGNVPEQGNLRHGIGRPGIGQVIQAVEAVRRFKKRAQNDRTIAALADRASRLLNMEIRA